MSTPNIIVVKRFLQLLELTELAPTTQEILTEDVRYDVVIARTFPLRRQLQGRRQVTDYLSILRSTYQVEKATEHTLIETEDKVIAMGSERAYLPRTKKLVHTEWTAIFELRHGRIHSISMMCYRWTVLAEQSPISVRVPSYDSRESLPSGRNYESQPATGALY